MVPFRARNQACKACLGRMGWIERIRYGLDETLDTNTLVARMRRIGDPIVSQARPDLPRRVGVAWGTGKSAQEPCPEAASRAGAR